jgi:addiction module RelE/StbE family toxin
MKLEWTRIAIADLVEARSYVEQESPQAAAELAQRILAAVEELLDLPELGRIGRIKGTHELIVPDTSYLIIYRLKPGHLQILRVYHARRRWPPARTRAHVQARRP